MGENCMTSPPSTDVSDTFPKVNQRGMLEEISSNTKQDISILQIWSSCDVCVWWGGFKMAHEPTKVEVRMSFDNLT